MTDEERAEHVLSCLSSNYHIDATRGAFTRRESDVSAIADAFRAIREEAARDLDWYKTGARFAFVAAGGVGVSIKAVEKWIDAMPKDFQLQERTHGTPGEGVTRCVADNEG